MHTARIYSQDIGMEFDIEKWVLLVMKIGKWHLTDGIELPNQDKIRTLAENETYKYVIRHHQTSRNEKNNSKRYISRELVNYSRQGTPAETLSKEYVLVLYPSLDTRDPFSSGPERNLEKWTKELEN